MEFDATKFRPRNTLVLLRLIKNEEEKVGDIVIPKDVQNQYLQAEILAVGPGCIPAAGGQTGLEDLKRGQTVLVKAYHPKRNNVGGVTLEPEGVPLNHYDKKQEDLMLFEHMNIVAILSD